MTTTELQNHLESLLFVASEPTDLAQFAAALEASKEQIEAALLELDAQLQTRGLRIQRRGQRVQLATAPAAAPYVEKFLGLSALTRLSHAALETLAIIAYRQPVTRAEIEVLRGVDCDGVLRTLLARQLIVELERLDTAGHPIRYGTTFEFLRYFGLQTLAELPPLPPEPAPSTYAVITGEAPPSSPYPEELVSQHPKEALPTLAFITSDNVSHQEDETITPTRDPTRSPNDPPHHDSSPKDDHS
jgi:segregation and condensation protein B